MWQSHPRGSSGGAQEWRHPTLVSPTGLAFYNMGVQFCKNPAALDMPRPIPRPFLICLETDQQGWGAKHQVSAVCGAAGSLQSWGASGSPPLGKGGCEDRALNGGDSSLGHSAADAVTDDCDEVFAAQKMSLHHCF